MFCDVNGILYVYAIKPKRLKPLKKQIEDVEKQIKETEATT